MKHHTFLSLFAFLTLSCHCTQQVYAAPAKSHKQKSIKVAKYAKSGNKLKKATDKLFPPAEEAKAKLAALGIMPDTYEYIFQDTLFGFNCDYQKLALLIAAGADATTPRKWEVEKAARALSCVHRKADGTEARELLQTEMAPITVALLTGNEAAAKVLLKAPGFDTQTWTPLEQAALAGNTQKALKLIKAGANAFEHGESGCSPVGIAATLGKEECLKAMLLAPESKKTAQDLLNNPDAKYIGCNGGERIAWLVAAGEDMMAPHVANSRRSILEQLIMHRDSNPALLRIALTSPTADMYITDFTADINGPTLFHGAIELYIDGENIKEKLFLKTLVKHDTKQIVPSLHRAVILGDRKELQKLLSKGANANDKMKMAEGVKYNDPPLYSAIQLREYACMQLLLKAGATPDYYHVFWDNKTPLLHLSISLKAPIAVKLLLEAGANPNAKAIYGKKEIPTIQCLLENGDADVTKTFFTHAKNFNTEGISPLVMSTLKQDYSQMQKLIDNGENAGIDSAINYVCRTGDEKGLDILLNSKNLNINNTNALCLAFEKRNLNMFKKILSTPGIDVNKDGGNGFGHIPIQAIACYHDATEFLKLLINTPGIDLNKIDRNKNGSALYRAIQDKNELGAQLLRDAGAKEIRSGLSAF